MYMTSVISTSNQWLCRLLSSWDSQSEGTARALCMLHCSPPCLFVVHVGQGRVKTLRLAAPSRAWLVVLSVCAACSVVACLLSQCLESESTLHIEYPSPQFASHCVECQSALLPRVSMFSLCFSSLWFSHVPWMNRTVRNRSSIGLHAGPQDKILFKYL